MAAAGDKDAKDEFEWLLRNSLDEIKKQIERKSNAGELSSRLPPIATLLEMCYFATPLLLRLSESQSENVKKYARARWQWPSLIHLSKREQSKYETALPVKELGADLQLKIYPSRTNGDHLFELSAHAVFCVTRFERDEDNIPYNLAWARWHHKPLQKLYGDKFQTAAEKFLASRGKFTRPNWEKWKPAFDTFLTLRFGPFDERFALLKPLGNELVLALKEKTENEWLEKFRKRNPKEERAYMGFSMFLFSIRRQFLTEPPLQESEHQEIQKKIAHIKTENGKWIELKDEILKRISKLAPAA